jgi:hypothetical protein
MKNLCLALIVVIFLILGNQAQAILFSDNFANLTKWTESITSGPAGQFTPGSEGLSYLGESGRDHSTLVSKATFYPGVEVVMSFSNYSSNSTFTPGEPLPSSSKMMFGMGNINDLEFVGFGGVWWPSVPNPPQQPLYANHLNGNSGRFLEPPIIGPISESMSGKLKLVYEVGSVDFFYDLGLGWKELGSYNPSWSIPVPVFIAGMDGPTGTTSFEINCVSVVSTTSSVPEPMSILLLISGLVGAVSIKMRG